MATMLTARVAVHADRNRMFELGQSLGLRGQVLTMFSHGCTDVELELAVEAETGLVTIVGVDGREVGARRG